MKVNILQILKKGPRSIVVAEVQGSRIIIPVDATMTEEQFNDELKKRSDQILAMKDNPIPTAPTIAAPVQEKPPSFLDGMEGTEVELQ